MASQIAIWQGSLYYRVGDKQLAWSVLHGRQLLPLTAVIGGSQVSGERLLFYVVQGCIG